MRILLSLAAAAVMSAAPVLASAQDYRHDEYRGDDRGRYDGRRDDYRSRDYSYGREDPCARKQAVKTQQGAVTGGLIGATAGYLLGGRGHKVAGAVVGGAVGATAGGAIARNNFRCTEYPRGYYAHRNCRWVNDDGHSFEICRGRDGEWRPYRDR